MQVGMRSLTFTEVRSTFHLSGLPSTTSPSTFHLPPIDTTCAIHESLNGSLFLLVQHRSNCASMMHLILQLLYRLTCRHWKYIILAGHTECPCVLKKALSPTFNQLNLCKLLPRIPNLSARPFESLPGVVLL